MRDALVILCAVIGVVILMSGAPKTLLDRLVNAFKGPPVVKVPEVPWELCPFDFKQVDWVCTAKPEDSPGRKGPPQKSEGEL